MEKQTGWKGLSACFSQTVGLLHVVVLLFGLRRELAAAASARVEALAAFFAQLVAASRRAR